MSYSTHLSINELTFIESHHEQGHSNRSIARRLERSPETVSRVIRKMTLGFGAPQIYNQYAENKKRCGRKKIELSSADNEYIESKVKLGWTTYPNTSLNPLPLTVERSSPTGKVSLTVMILIFILLIQERLPKEGLTKTPTGCFAEMDYLRKWTSKRFLRSMLCL